MVTWSTSWRAGAAALLFSVAACSSGGDGGTDPTPEEPITVSITLGTASVEVTQGANAATVQISIDRPAGFRGTVNLAASAPAGITATLSPAALTGTATTSTLSIAASANVAAGDYGVTVTATGTNVATQSLVVPLSVKTGTTTPPPAGSFTIAASPTAVSVQAGNQGTSAITITRVNNFAGAVALTATGAPAGVTPSFAPASVVATSSTLTLTTTGAAVPGVYPITVRANATGQTEQTAVVTLTVTAAPGGGGGGGNVSWSFCGTLAPLWFAAQDGTGAWTRITATTPGVYQFNITQARGGVAYVQQEGTRFVQKMFFLTQAELIEAGASLCPNGTAKTLNGSVVNAPSASVQVGLGGSRTAVTTLTSTNFTLTNVADGPRDLVAGRSTIATFPPSLTFDRIFIRRNVNIANGGTIPAIDFSGAESFAPVARTLTLGNTTGHQITVSTAFSAANAGGSGLVSMGTSTLGAVSSAQWFAVPADRVIAGDKQIVTVSAIASATIPASLNGRSLVFYTAAPQDANLTFGPLLTGATETALGTSPYVRRRVQYTPQAEYNRYFTGNWQHDASGGRTAEIQMSSGYTSGGAVDLSMPDFSGVAGFNADWGLKVGASTTWTFTAVGWTGSGLSAPTADGAVSQSAQAGNQITP